MTATALKGILLTPEKAKRKRPVSANCGISCTKRNNASTTLLCMNGKLRNLRNYYARRRPSIQAPLLNNRIVVTPPPRSTSDRWVQFRSGDKLNRIHLIPSRKDYSKEDKLALWTPKKQLKQLIHKNYREYSYEGRDWRNAPEEDEFVTIPGHKEPMHPVYKAEQRQAQEDKTVVKITPKFVSPKKKRTKPRTTTHTNRLSLRKLPMAKRRLVSDEDDNADESMVDM